MNRDKSKDPVYLPKAKLSSWWSKIKQKHVLRFSRSVQFSLISWLCFINFVHYWRSCPRSCLFIWIHEWYWYQWFVKLVSRQLIRTCASWSIIETLVEFMGRIFVWGPFSDFHINCLRIWRTEIPKLVH